MNRNRNNPQPENPLTLIILRGIPGSGKSFAAKKYSPPNALIFSTDDFWGLDYNFNPKKLGEAHSWNKGRVEGAMKASHHYIVVDNTNTTRKEMKPYIDMAKAHGYIVTYRYPNSPWWEEIYPRIKDKTFTDEDVKVFYEKNTHNVPFDVIKKMMQRFQF